MTHTELLEVITDGENSGVEFKRDVIENHALAKELVAFSNLNGGMVLLGVDDDGSIFGIARPNLEEWVMTTCRDKIRPGIIPFFEVFREVEPGKDVAIVSVTRGYAVHSLWHNNRNTYYIRVGTQSREPSPEELRTSLSTARRFSCRAAAGFRRDSRRPRQTATSELFRPDSRAGTCPRMRMTRLGKRFL